MPIALALLILLIGISPVAVFRDGPLALGVWLAVLAVPLFVVGRSLRPADASQIDGVIRPIVGISLAPIIVMAFQAAPMPAAFWLNNTIWDSAAAALGRPLSGSISVDTGLTLLSICRYSAWLGMCFVTCAIAIDRRRAEWLLYTLTLASAITATVLVANDIVGFGWFDRSSTAHAAALDIAALGVILSSACAARAYERSESRRDETNRSPSTLFAIFTACFLVFAICGLGVALDRAVNAPFAAAAGIATLLGITFIRRLGFGTVAALAAVALICIIAGEIVVARLAQGGPDITLRFAAPSPALGEITERMLADGTWTGTGAGTYRDLVPIYLGPLDVITSPQSPSAAAQVAIEFGRPLLWVAILVSCSFFVLLVHAAFRRGRDSVYPVSGAATVVTLLITAFGNDGLFNAATLIITGVILGSAFAQSRSRTAQ